MRSTRTMSEPCLQNDHQATGRYLHPGKRPRDIQLEELPLKESVSRYDRQGFQP